MCNIKSTVLVFLNIFSLSYSLPFKFAKPVVNLKGDSVLTLDTGNNATCLPLEECPTYSWMLNNKNVENDIINIKSFSVNKFLRQKRCAIADASSNKEVTMDTLIACPNTDDDAFDYEEYDDYENVDEDTQIRGDYEEDCVGGDNGIGGGLTTKKVSQELECTLEITHQSLVDATELKTKRLSGTKNEYRRLIRLRTRKILHMKAHGNCCWECYDKEHLKGEITNVDPANDVVPDVQPKSIKRICC